VSKLFEFVFLRFDFIMSFWQTHREPKAARLQRAAAPCEPSFPSLRRVASPKSCKHPCLNVWRDWQREFQGIPIASLTVVLWTASARLDVVRFQSRGPRSSKQRRELPMSAFAMNH